MREGQGRVKCFSKAPLHLIEGLLPPIAVEQRSSGSNPRSIIATTTEVYDYSRLRSLFHSLALKAEGGLVAWSDDFTGQTSVPGALSNVVVQLV